jgi:predicted O-methyltransferase YrrM
VRLNPQTLARRCCAPEIWNEILAFYHLLATDEYIQYTNAFYIENMKTYGASWWYLDITNVLYAAAKVLQPHSYLEIGVRRGRSLCVVARACPTVNILGIDMWMQGYAGMENPGKDFVAAELKKHGHVGTVDFIDGDSHQIVPALFKQNPALRFDLITVDGDHSEAGALDDLQNVVSHLAVGGVLVFDDLSHPAHPYMADVWRRLKTQAPYLATYEFDEVGYGVAFAIRTAE